MRKFLFFICTFVFTVGAWAGASKCVDALASYEKTSDVVNETDVNNGNLKELTELIKQEIKTEMEFIKKEIELVYHELELVGNRNFDEQLQKLMIQREKLIMRGQELINQQTVGIFQFDDSIDLLKYPVAERKAIVLGNHVLTKRKTLNKKLIKLINKQIQLIREPNFMYRLFDWDDLLIKRRITLIRQFTKPMVRQITVLMKFELELVTLQQSLFTQEQMASINLQNEKLAEQELTEPDKQQSLSNYINDANEHDILPEFQYKQSEQNPDDMHLNHMNYNDVVKEKDATGIRSKFTLIPWTPMDLIDKEDIHTTKETEPSKS